MSTTGKNIGPVSQDRDRSIDVAKGIGILLVVLGHNKFVTFEKAELFEAIFSFHMPLFFFLSGIFYKPSVNFFKLIKKKSISLLKPYLVVAATWASLEVSLGRAAPSEAYFGVLYATGPTIELTPLWFLPHLFILYCAARALEALKLLSKEHPHRALLAASIMLLVGVMFLQSFWHSPTPFVFPIVDGARWQGLPFSVDIVPVTLFYFSLGYIFSNRVEEVSGNYIAIVFAAIFVYTHWKYDDLIDLNYRLYTNWFVCTAQAICGIVVVLNLAKRLEKIWGGAGTIFSYIGSNSLFILMFHWPLQQKVYFMLRDADVERLDQFAAWTSFVMAILGSLVLSEAIRRTAMGRTLFL